MREGNIYKVPLNYSHRSYMAVQLKTPVLPVVALTVIVTQAPFCLAQSYNASGAARSNQTDTTAPNQPESMAANQSGANTASDQLNNTAAAQPGSNPGSLTADMAKNGSTDLAKMQEIRKFVVADASLSISARNVKIIARNGKVTLKGPVRS